MPSSDEPRRPTTPSEAAEATKPARIVVADDDRIGRELLASVLRGAGHVVDAVEDGQEAVERAAQGSVDLVLLDIVMPRLSGIEACRLLKGMTLDTFLPVILVTVKSDTASRVEGLRIGADDYVSKPFEEAELLARVQAMLRIKRLHEQITAQKARFERLSVHDELTGLYNFRFLHTRLGEEWKRAERNHEPFACVLVDIDQLRAFNEAGGRLAGDIAIRRVAEAIARSVREADVVARYGGEEYLAVLPSTHFAGSVAVAERIWREVATIEVCAADLADTPGAAEKARWVGEPRRPTVSIGVALYPSRDVKTKDAVIRAAEAALSQAKREGGDRICVFQQQGYIYTPVSDGGLTRLASDPLPAPKPPGHDGGSTRLASDPLPAPKPAVHDGGLTRLASDPLPAPKPPGHDGGSTRLAGDPLPAPKPPGHDGGSTRLAIDPLPAPKPPGHDGGSTRLAGDPLVAHDGGLTRLASEPLVAHEGGATRAGDTMPAPKPVGSDGGSTTETAEARSPSSRP